MKVPAATLLAAAAILGVSAFGLLRSNDTAGRTRPAAQSAPADRTFDEGAEPEAVGMNAEPSLPPGHPAIGANAGPSLPPGHPPIGASSPGEAAGGAPQASGEAPAIAWTVPEGWATLPNPTAMRIATYRPASDCELAVVRAGGSTEANVQRWIGQFDEPARSRRSRKDVRGLGVEIVEVSGTYAGGGMMSGAPSQPQPGWSLLGAVVETRGSHYFFKLLGPADQVRAARASFDALVASVRPL